MSEKTLDTEIRYYEDGTQATAENLNKPLEDLAKTGQYMSQAQFEKDAETNREIYAGSGFTDFGGTYKYPTWNSNGFWNIYGIHTLSKNLCIGRAPSSSTTTDNGHASININGVKIKFGLWAHDNAIPFADGSNASVETGNFLTKDYKQGDFIVLKNQQEKIVNGSKGTFNLSDWEINNADVSIVNDNIKIDDSANHGGYSSIYQRINLVEGVEYVISYTSESTNNTTWVTIGSDLSNNSILGHGKIESSVPGTYTCNFKANKSCLAYVQLGGSSDIVAEFSNFSLKTKSLENIVICTDNLLDGDPIGYGLSGRESVSTQDLIFVESWHELISDRDFAYPYGNTQYYANLGDQVIGDFEDKDTYSLFGDWQEPGSNIGYGWKWSTLSKERKLQIAQDKNNNIYISKDGLVQVRYRIRVIKSSGWNMDCIKAQSWNSNFITQSNVVLTPRGKRSFSIIKDLSLGHNQSYQYVGAPRKITHTFDGLFYTEAASSSNSYNNEVVGLPIALVNRRNSGMYHPVFNPEGTKLNASGELWYMDSTTASSTSDCFTTDMDTSDGAGAKAGGSNKCGHPRLTYFDDLFSSDVLDLRMSAEKIDIDKILDFSNPNNNYNGLNRGITYTRKTCTEIGQNYWGVLDDDHLILHNFGHIPDSTEYIGDAVPYGNGIYYNPVGITIEGNKYWGKPVGSSNSHILFETIAHGLSGELWQHKNRDRILATTTTNSFFTDTNLTCNIVGDPKNYPQEWKLNGISAEPLLINRLGEYINAPDGTETGWNTLANLNNINLGFKYCLIYKDGKYTKLTHTSSGNGIINSNINRVQFYNDDNVLNLDGSELWLLFYISETEKTVVSDNIAPYKIGNVMLDSDGNVQRTSYEFLKRSIPNITSRDYESMPLKTFGSNLSTNSSYEFPTHEKGNLAKGAGVGIKILNTIVKDNNKLAKLSYFKELIWDDSSDTSILIQPDTDTILKKGQVFTLNDQFVNSPLNGMLLEWIGTDNTTINWSDNSWDNLTVHNNRIIWNSNMIDTNIKIWDGNGWGDDNHFQIRDKVSTMLDDNGNYVMYGTRKVELPYFAF